MKGPQWSIVEGVCEWMSWAPNGYIDTTLYFERYMSKLPIESESLSDDEEHVLSLGNGVPGGRPRVWR